MAGHMKKMSEQFVKFPGAPSTLGEVTKESFADSPFVDEIAKMEIPKKFVVPTMTLYSGVTDPVDHVAHYRQRMTTISVLPEQKEACLCIGFGSTLTGQHSFGSQICSTKV